MDLTILKDERSVSILISSVISYLVGLKREQEKCMTFIEEQLEEDGIQWRGIADWILDKNGELYKMVLEQIKKEKENGLSLLSKRGNKAQSTPKNALVSTRKISR